MLYIIPKFNIAIEYQGKQHFEPIEFFGGTEGLTRTKNRDTEKLLLSKKHGVKLIYINYWEDVSESLLLEKIEKAMGLDTTP